MVNKNKQILTELKGLDFSESKVTLAIVKEYKKERASRYSIKYVPINDHLEKRLKSIFISQIKRSNTVEEYTFDCPEPEEDQVRAINYEETDFYKISQQLNELNPEENVIESVDELVLAKAYLIVVRNIEGIQAVGFKTLPENWKMQQSKGLIPLLYKNNRFIDLETDNVFSISSTINMFYYKEVLFILSKKEFERGLNFRKGMMNSAQEVYLEFVERKIFINMEVLQKRVGDNQRYLRKIAIIHNLGYYRNPLFLERLQLLSIEKNWNVQFDNGKIVFTDETIDDILTLLQNKRLHSQLTDEDFDVDSAKLLQ